MAVNCQVGDINGGLINVGLECKGDLCFLYLIMCFFYNNLVGFFNQFILFQSVWSGWFFNNAFAIKVFVEVIIIFSLEFNSFIKVDSFYFSPVLFGFGDYLDDDCGISGF